MILELDCITHHAFLPKLLDPIMLEIMLRSQWEITKGHKDITNRLRFLINYVFTKKTANVEEIIVQEFVKDGRE